MKKMLSLILSLLLFSASLLGAQATDYSPSVPVITIPVVAPVVSEEVQYAENFAIAPVAVVSEKVQVVMQEIIAQAQETSVSAFFEETVQQEIVSLLPEDVALEALTVDEVSALQVDNYQEDYGDVKIEIAFATAYTQDAQLIVMLGIIDGDAIDWHPVETEVVDGKVLLVLSQELLGLMDGHETVVALLRAV